MEERRSEHREGWVLVVEKALRWLKSGGNLPTLMDSARMVVRGERWKKENNCLLLLLDEAEFDNIQMSDLHRCNKGHPLSQVARQPGEMWHCDVVGGCPSAPR